MSNFLLKQFRKIATYVALSLGTTILFLPTVSFALQPVVNPQTGAVGMQGTIPAAPPTQAATITVPSNGQVFKELPVTVSGLCPGDLLVKIFKNNVFAGSVQCKNNSYSILVDLFVGSNELVARVYDAFDQAGPDSNTVKVTFDDNKNISGPRVSLTSNYAKKGSNPGEELSWPIVVSGGTGPFAITVDWGDGKPVDLSSKEFAGEFIAKHKYDAAGIYNIVVKAVDKNGGTAFIQLVGIANGPLSQDVKKDTGTASTDVTTKTKFILWPIFALFPLIVLTFWIGKRYELKRIRHRIEEGQHGF
jgi:hypothetical protein